MFSMKLSVQVIELLIMNRQMGVQAVAAQLVIPLGSVHRLLLDLEEEATFQRATTGERDLWFRRLKITGMQLEQNELQRLYRPHAECIAPTTLETVNLNALAGKSGVSTDKVRGNDGMEFDMRIGSRGPLYCGGGGIGDVERSAAQ